MGAGILLFVVAILVVVMVHESGHFLVAKAFGFKATQFFVGFGPTLWSFRKGETEYGVKAIPAGGFVKIIGMNPYEEVATVDQPRAYPNKPAWQRALLLVAGSATHWVVAFVLLVFMAMAIGYPTDVTNEIASIETGSAAAASALSPGDRIVGVDGEETRSWQRIRSFIRSHPGDEVTFTVAGDGGTRAVSVTLGSAIFNEQGRLVAAERSGRPERELRPGDELVGFLGVSPVPFYETKSLPAALGDAAQRTGQLTVLSVRGIGQVFGMVFNGELFDALTGEGTRAPGEGPLGLVGAGRVAGQSVEQGRYLDFLGLIVGFTIFVGLMNLLPLPPLDGGHLAVVGYEAATGRKVDIRKLIPVAGAVIAFFVLLFLAVLYLDLARPIRVPF